MCCMCGFTIKSLSYLFEICCEMNECGRINVLFDDAINIQYTIFFSVKNGKQN